MNNVSQIVVVVNGDSPVLLHERVRSVKMYKMYKNKDSASLFNKVYSQYLRMVTLKVRDVFLHK